MNYPKNVVELFEAAWRMEDKYVVDSVFPEAGSDDQILPVDHVGKHVGLVPQNATVAFVPATECSSGFDAMGFKKLQ